MNRRAGKVRLVFALAAALAGCGAEPEPVRLNLAGAQPSADVSDLAAVLAEAVTEDGRVKPAEVKRLTGRLDSQLRKMALTGPTATPKLYPTDSARWAYWYNARAAWSVKLAALEGFLRCVHPSVMLRRRFPLDGRSMSLEQIDAIVLAESRRTGDFRLAACAPGVCADYAPLPNRPYSPRDLPARLRGELDSLILAGGRFVLDVEKKQVRVPAMLWACRDMIVAQYERQYGRCGANLIIALRPHLGSAARRRLEEALGFGLVVARGGQLAIPRRKMFYPGKIGRIEP